MKSFFLILASLFIFCYASPSAFSETNFWYNEKDEIIIEKLFSQMNDSQKLGQLMLFGYMGGLPSNEIIKWISKNEIGGVKIFGWNVADLQQCAKSIYLMQKASQTTSFKIPLFVVTDQEGGWVRHINKGTSETSGNMSLSAGKIPEDSFKTGYYIGLEMRSIGINMNFAPTVDVYSNKKAHVIGPRAFSDDPIITASLSTAYFKGMDKAGIICTAKHYPGHGDADKDSHGALPIIYTNTNTLWKRDLLPFRYLVKEGLPAIMSGHLAFPNITGNNIPASISKYFLTDILRKKMQYKGLIVTDDIMMNGVQHLPMTTPQICKESILAGNDIILLSRTPELQVEVWNYLLEELSKDEEFNLRVNDSCKRVLRIKLKYLKKSDSVPLFPDYEKVDDYIASLESKNFFFDQAARSVTLLRKNKPEGLMPKGRILLVGQYKRFLAEGKIKFPDADSFYFQYSPFYTSSDSVKERLKNKIKKYDTIVFCLANPNSAEVLKSLKTSSEKIIVFSVLNPVYVSDIEWIKNAIAVYGTSKDAFMAGFSVLTGEIQAKGELPLKSFF